MAAKHTPVKVRFTATHSVRFGDGADEWAHFTRDRSADRNGVAGYSFVTDDPDVAERIRAVEGYGIEEVTPQPDAGE